VSYSCCTRPLPACVTWPRLPRLHHHNARTHRRHEVPHKVARGALVPHKLVARLLWAQRLCASAVRWGHLRSCVDLCLPAGPLSLTCLPREQQQLAHTTPCSTARHGAAWTTAACKRGRMRACLRRPGPLDCNKRFTRLSAEPARQGGGPSHLWWCVSLSWRLCATSAASRSCPATRASGTSARVLPGTRLPAAACAAGCAPSILSTKLQQPPRIHVSKQVPSAGAACHRHCATAPPSPGTSCLPSCPPGRRML